MITPKDSVTIICENLDRKEIEFEAGCTLLQIATGLGVTMSQPIIAAYVNNRLKELDNKIYNSADVAFLDITSFAGMSVYKRTISLVLQCAVEELFPTRHLYIRHSMGVNGLYCEVESREGDDERLSEAEVFMVECKMRAIIKADDKITRHKLPTNKVREIYSQRSYADKVSLLDTRPRLYSEIYELRQSVGYFYGPLAPSTRYVDSFSVEPYYNGFYIGLPRRDNPSELSESPQQVKMFGIFRLHQRWIDVMGVHTVGALNQKVLRGDSSEMIKLSEALSERGIAMVADQIEQANKDRGARLVLLAGPSSSGKTTTAKRIGVQLQVLGFKPVLISLDDYFVDRELTPRDESGDYDFEALEAIDLPRFNRDLNRLFAGESVDIPRYDFITGRSRTQDKPLKLAENSILIVEGIHGLNPRLTPDVVDDMIYRIYVSCFTTIAMDDVSNIASSDNRLLRRIIRDFSHRGSSGQATLKRWASVRRGEERHIFPYQENADWMINSAQFYEIAVLRPYAEKILREVPNTGAEYNEACRLLKFLDNFLVIEPDEIPPTSTLREFIGGGSFEY